LKTDHFKNTINEYANYDQIEYYTISEKGQVKFNPSEWNDYEELVEIRGMGFKHPFKNVLFQSKE
jgi:hypothetical protein